MKLFNCLVLGMLLFGCKPNSSPQLREAAKLTPHLILPEIPMVITDERQAADYLAVHFWDSFNFNDTTFLHAPEVEQWFASYVETLRKSSRPSEAATSLMVRRDLANSKWLPRFAELATDYLADAHSPLRNEELYIPFAMRAIKSNTIPGAVKVRYQQRLELAMRNRIGEEATDFQFFTANAKRHRLSDYRGRRVLLFFNNPDCHECSGVKQELLESGPLNELIRQKELSLITVYIDKDLEIWRKARYPEQWTNGYDNGEVSDKALYNLDAIPTLYLLDDSLRVVLKDPTVEEIESWITEVL